MGRFRLLSLVLTGMFPLLNALAGTPQEDAASTIVIYNQNDLDAKSLADYYCTARSIDPLRVIGLAVSTNEEISRTEYDTTIAVSLRQEMIQRGFWVVSEDENHHPIVSASCIHYAAVIRGIPLKIADCTNYPGDNAKLQPPPFGSCTAASVDSELSILGLYNSQISGVLNNPLCRKPIESPDGSKPSGKSNQADAPQRIPTQLLLVGRLDGPSVNAIKAIISNGISAEKEGLWGWGYVDLRSVTDPGYIRGDQWIRKAGEVMRKHGIPVLSDDLPETFQSGFPITEAAAYYGWYSDSIDGPFRDTAFHFMPGAVAAHLHSFSATTLRDPAKGWTGPLIEKGASASVGNVYEPYLIFTTDFGIMEESLLAGSNLAESYYAAQPVLSWMSILVGDPLYRPYAALTNANVATPTLWTDYRQIILNHQGNVLMAAHDLGVRARETGESLYLEALGAAQYDMGVFAAAGASFRDAAQIAKDPQVKFRLLLEQARVYEKRGKPEKGVSLLAKEAPRVSDPAQRSLLLAWIARMSPIQQKSRDLSH